MEKNVLVFEAKESDFSIAKKKFFIYCLKWLKGVTVNQLSRY